MEKVIVSGIISTVIYRSSQVLQLATVITRLYESPRQEEGRQLVRCPIAYFCIDQRDIVKTWTG